MAYESAAQHDSGDRDIDGGADGACAALILALDALRENIKGEILLPFMTASVNHDTNMKETRREGMEKKLSKMTEKEILRWQYELLAEKSRTCEDNCLSGITNSMLAVYSVLVPRDSSVV